MEKASCVLDFLDFLTAISCRFGVRGPLLERVPVHAPQCRGHNFILKNDFASFEENRTSVTKARPKHIALTLIVLCLTFSARDS